MKSRTHHSAKERVELQWRADRHDGFQKATLIYDVHGKLMAVDYEPIRTTPPATPQS
jgi:hypothetical protein